jgi:predicted MFS family arabinose efflux permease
MTGPGIETAGGAKADGAARDRWGVIVAYALLAGATQMLWLTFAAVTTESARGYHVSVGAIGVLSEIFLFFFVALAIPAGRLLDRHFRVALTGGAALVAVGGLVRTLGPSYGSALAGQVLVALAQPLVLSAVTKLSGEALTERSQPTGVAIGSAGNFVGMVLAVILGPALVKHNRLEPMLVVEALIAVVPAIWLIVTLRGLAPRTDTAIKLIDERAVGRLWRDPVIRLVCALVFLGFGIFVALATWLQTLLHPSGVSDHAAGLLLTSMIVAGVVGCALFPAAVARRGAERAYMLAIVIATAAACLGLAAADTIGLRAVLLIAIGLVLLPALPVTLVIAEQRSGPRAAGTAGALIWMAGNLGGLVVSLAVQAVVHHAAIAFVLMAAVALLGAPLSYRLRPAETAEQRPQTAEG